MEYKWILWHYYNCRQFKLLSWTSFIGHFDHQVKAMGIGLKWVYEGFHYFSPL